MADEVLKVGDGESHLRIADPSGGVVIAPLAEIGPGGALASIERTFDVNAYLDVTVTLKGQPPRQFFANVVTSGPAGLRLAWMHIDPGEQGRLRALLEAYRGSAEGGTRTRRILKPSSIPSAPASAPSSAEFTPFSDPAAGAGTRVGTRRILKPGAPAAPPAPSPRGDLMLDDQDQRDESRLHPVVIASTDRFTRMVDEPTVTKPAAPVPAASSVGEALVDAGFQPAGATEAVAPSAPEPERGTVVGQDGRMDIGATIRNKAKTVRASELAARHDKVRVLNMATIKALIQDAVEEAANHLTRALNEADRKRLLEEAEESFQERLKAFQLEKADADERANKLHEQLASAQRLLEEERKRTISADQFTMSAAGMDDLEAKFSRMVERSAAEGKVSGSLLDELRKAASHVLDEERQRIREKEMQAQNDKIALLEKKISRLAGNLDEAERQRDEARQLAQALEANSGSGPVDVERIKNKFKTGLDGDDPRKAAKLAAMKELMEANRELRRQLGISLQAVTPKAEVAPAPDPTPAPAPSPEPVAAAPVEPVIEVEDDGGEPAAPEVDPDDLPWTPEPEVAAAPESDEMVGGVKRIRTFAAKPPPPMTAAPEPVDAVTEDAEEAGEPEANPDDEIWEPPAPVAEAAPDASAGGVKKITSFKAFAPPPLNPR